MRHLHVGPQQGGCLLQVLSKVLKCFCLASQYRSIMFNLFAYNTSIYTSLNMANEEPLIKGEPPSRHPRLGIFFRADQI